MSYSIVPESLTDSAAFALSLKLGRPTTTQDNAKTNAKKKDSTLSLVSKDRVGILTILSYPPMFPSICFPFLNNLSEVHYRY
jgi:hypothetical protein